jgi:hypothetical protein
MIEGVTSQDETERLSISHRQVKIILCKSMV